MGLRTVHLAGLAAFGTTAALGLQLPAFLQPGEQAPLAGQDADASSIASLKQVVETEALQGLIKSENLLARAKELYSIAELSLDEYNHPTRVIGSEGHKGTLSYIWKTISGLGGYYTLSTQPFTAVSGNVYESRLVLGSTVPSSASAMSLTPPTKNKEPVHGDLVFVEQDGCDASNYPEALKGNIAFIRRGTCSFGDKSALAGKAGAVAAVVYNYEPDSVAGTLGTPSKDHVPTFGLSGREAAPFIQKLLSGERVDSIAYIDSVVEEILTNNIIAQTVLGDPDNCVMLGGHSDSVAEGPGINDDGSGSLSLLEVATQLTRFKVNNCVRFAWFAGEEEGLLGSDHYVEVLPEEENIKIRLFMDYDMMASPNYAYQIYNATNDANPLGSQELRDLYVDWYEAHGLNYTFVPFDGRSDYDGFIRNSIPGGGIATGAEGIKTKEEQAVFGGKAGDWYDPCYHQLCDDVSNVNATAWEVNTKLIAHSVATFAFSFDGFPTRSIDLSSASMSANTRMYHGSKLVM